MALVLRRAVTIAAVGAAFATVAAFASDVSHIRLVRTRDEGPDHQREPGWVLTIDREMAAELTSKASVEECERQFEKGAEACDVELSPCMDIEYHPTDIPEASLLLRIHPEECRDAQRPDLTWTASADHPLRVVEVIPVGSR